MQKIIIAGHKIRVRGLKIKELRSLREQGFNISNLKHEEVEEVFMLCLDMVLSKEDKKKIDNVVFKELWPLWKTINEETYGSVEEIKNSLGSGDGTQTPKE